MPQIFNAYLRLRDNLLFSFLWRKLSAQDKQTFLSNPANVRVPPQTDYNSPEFQSQLRPLYENRRNTHLKPENVERALPLVSKFPLLDYVKATQPQLLPQADAYIKNMLNTYMESFKPPLSSTEMYSVLEKYPNPGSPIQRLPRFDKATRAQRKETSRIIRSALTDYTMWETTKTDPYSTAGQDFNRVHKTFFRPEKTPQDQLHNREVAILFNTKPNASRAEDRSWVREQLQKNPPYQEVNGVRQQQPWTPETLEQAVDAYFTPEAMRKRRGEILMESAREAQQVFQNLDALTSPNLTPQQIAQNYISIARTSALYMEFQNYAGDSKPGTGYFEISHQDRKWLIEQSELSMNCSHALFSLNMIANPLYEYVDPDALMSFNMEKSTKYYAGVFGEPDEIPPEDQNDPIFDQGSREDVQNRAMKKKDPYYKTHTDNLRDSLDCLISDAYQAQDALVNSRKYACEQMIETFGFTRGATRRYSETYGNLGKPSPYDFRQPVAYALQDRVVILSHSPSPKDGFISREHPEELYNFNLNNTLESVGEAYRKANRWYTDNVSGYETVGARFSRVCELGKLGRLRSPRDLEQLTKAYKALLNDSNYYLEKKGDHPKAGLETQRVEAIKKMKHLATMKLNELNLVSKAVVTLNKYQGKTTEQIRTETARENAQPQYAQHINNEITAARQEDPVKWLSSQCTLLYSGTLTSSALDLSGPGSYLTGRLELLGRAKEPFAATDNNKNLIAGIAGSMATREAMEQERKRLNTPRQPGKLEQQLQDMEVDALRTSLVERGKQILREATGKELDALTSQDLKDFLTTFDQRRYVAQINQDYNVSPLDQKLTGQYLNAITPARGEKLDQYEQKLHQFTQESILTPAQGLLTDPNAPADMEQAKQLLSSCVLNGMIQMERAGGNSRQPGLMETTLSTPQGAAELRQRVLISHPFTDMLAGLGQQPTNADVARLLEQNAPMNAAKLSMNLANRPQVEQNPPGHVPNAPQAGRAPNVPQARQNVRIPG